jgi:hypothetical protein
VTGYEVGEQVAVPSRDKDLSLHAQLTVRPTQLTVQWSSMGHKE